MARPRFNCWYLTGTTIALMALLCEGLAQEFDTVISSHNRRAYTILDQVEDREERRDLTTLLDQRETKERARLAERFLGTFSRSWLLAQVYEIAAKAFIDLGDLERALEYGRESLKLLPENPLLLVPLANTAIVQSQLEESRINARQALIFLDEFTPPLSVAKGKWPEIHSQLKASCYFVLGRAGVTKALSLPSGQRREALLRESEDSLQLARALNPQDGEVVYLLGLSQLSAGRLDAAALSFAHASQLPGAVQSKALHQLRSLHAAKTDIPPFESFLAQLLRRTPGPVKAIPLVDPPNESHGTSSQLSSEYAGSETCRQCHATQHGNWKQTGMSRMFRPYDPSNILGDFDQEQPFYAGDNLRWGGSRLEILPGKDRFVYARMLKNRGRHYFQIRQQDGRWVSYPVDYTIGSKWQQAYATLLPNGQIHVFPVQYNLLHRRWLNFWQIIDPEGSARADVRTFETFSPITSYQANCAVCHTSQLRNSKGGSFDVDHLEFREPGINCEMCHGPSGRHVGVMRTGRPYEKPAAEAPVDFTKISSREYLAICGQCHRQSAVRDAGPHGELNYWPSAPAFYPPNKSRPFGEFSRKAFYKDGRFRETTFIVESLQRSACFQKGQVNCGHCHDVHGKDPANNPKSLRFAADSDHMCTQCHTRQSLKAPAHTRHAGHSEASRCVSCHMPAIMNSMLFRARTHQIDDVPNVAGVERFGQEDSPNACLLCHQEKTVAWLKAEMGNR